jgi:hypothetical protein
MYPLDFQMEQVIVLKTLNKKTLEFHLQAV